MDVTPLVPKGQQIIQSYDHGGFRVSGQRYDTPVIVKPSSISEWSPATSEIADLQLSDFQDLIDQAHEIDVVLLGCGADMAFLPMPLKQELSAKGLPVEVMDTGAACRTYNVLMAEGRRVAAVLFPVL